MRTGEAIREPDATTQPSHDHGGEIGRRGQPGARRAVAPLQRHGSSRRPRVADRALRPARQYVASRVATGLPANVEQADLVSHGIFGLIDALEKFDLSREIMFQTYAIPRIRGAIIDELRSLDWVPRSDRFKAREVEKAYGELEARLKRAPSDQEVAEHLGVSLSELHDIVTQISFVTVSALGGGRVGRQ
jgi:RNA polymerase sigma factor (sigma-70 family)